MEIKWFGHSFFEVTIDTKEKKGIKIYFDPYSSEIGINPPSDLTADIVLVSHSHYDHNNLGAFKKIDLVIETAGEYSVKGLDIKGILSYHDNEKGQKKGPNVIYLLSAQNLRIAHLGDLGHLLTDNQINSIGTVNVLMVPIGGPSSIKGQESIKVIKQLEPNIIIPMHYKIPGVKIDLLGIDDFCKEIGVCLSEPVGKLSLKNNPLDEKKMEVVIMKKS